jgi:uncharacterized protein
MSRPPKWDDEFIRAVVNGDVAAAERSLALGLPVKKYVYGSKCYTPLHYAVDGRAKPAIVALLLEAGADVNAQTPSKSPLPGETPLMLAARHGRLDLVKQLLAAGADLHAKTVHGISALAQVQHLRGKIRW